MIRATRSRARKVGCAIPLTQTGHECYALSMNPTETMSLDAVNPRRTEYLEKFGMTHYRKRYAAGWKSRENGGSLERAYADGRASDSAWLDGFSDCAVGREKLHMLRCQDHDNLPTCNG